MTKIEEQSIPEVCILMATFNGEKWLDEQLRSIFSQRGVAVSVYASDDWSNDDTPRILSDWERKTALTQLPRSEVKFGSAVGNFLRLIADVPAPNDAYVGFSDQDDIWCPNKLKRACESLERSGSDAYSSDVIAVWSDGRRQLVKKSGDQRKFDFLFQGPGPGCTFVLTSRLYAELRNWVLLARDKVGSVPFHDWLIYVYARHHGWVWYIDDQPQMLYRQHETNEFGANVGVAATMRRWRIAQKGAYRNHVIANATVVGCRYGIVDSLLRLGFLDRIRLILNVHRCRRTIRECLVLAFLFLVMTRSKEIVD